jgi:hypothetical protein
VVWREDVRDAVSIPENLRAFRWCLGQDRRGADQDEAEDNDGRTTQDAEHGVLLQVSDNVCEFSRILSMGVVLDCWPARAICRSIPFWSQSSQRLVSMCPNLTIKTALLVRVIG